jgi:peptide/nickel transport system permease protein
MSTNSSGTLLKAADSGVSGALESAQGSGLFTFIGKLVSLKLAAAGLFVLCAVALVALFAPLIAPYDPNANDYSEILAGPSAYHLLGTDPVGRDILSRLIYGARVSLSVGLISVSIGAAIGVPLGLLAGYFGGVTDAVISRFVDALIAFPALILALAMVAMLGAGIQNVMIAIGVGTIPAYARIVRSQALTIREHDYIQAAKLLGAGQGRIVFRHVLPNALPPVLVVATLGLASAVLAEASLSFLGLGVKPPTPTWGNMLLEGYPVLRREPLFAIAPGVAIFLLVLSFNFVGDSLRDVLDPRLRGVIMKRPKQ